jgi:large subunit ribosomal protein L35
MPKMKSHSGAKKRFSLTGTGKVKFKHAKLRHMLVNRDPKVKRNARKTGILADVDTQHILRLLGKAS